MKNPEGSAHPHALERRFEAYLMQKSEMLPLPVSLALGEGPGGGHPLPAEEFWDNLEENGSSVKEGEQERARNG